MEKNSGPGLRDSALFDSLAKEEEKWVEAEEVEYKENEGKPKTFKSTSREKTDGNSTKLSVALEAI